MWLLQEVLFRSFSWCLPVHTYKSGLLWPVVLEVRSDLWITLRFVRKRMHREECSGEKMSHVCNCTLKSCSSQSATLFGRSLSEQHESGKWWNRDGIWQARVIAGKSNMPGASSWRQAGAGAPSRWVLGPNWTPALAERRIATEKTEVVTQWLGRHSSKWKTLQQVTLVRQRPSFLAGDVLPWPILPTDDSIQPCHRNAYPTWADEETKVQKSHETLL